MASWQARELRALFLGTGPFPRDEAPEPILLALLAPLLPPELLSAAVDAARGCSDAGTRAIALHALAFHFDRQDAGLLDEAYEAALSIEYRGDRGRLLARLAPSLPPRLRAEAVEAALASALPPHGEAELLETLAPLLTPSQHAATLASCIKWGELWWCLNALALYMPDELVPKAFAAAQAAKFPRDRAAAYDALSSRLSAEQWHDVLEDAARMDDNGAARTLERVAPNLPDVLVEQANDLIQRLQPDARDEALAALSARLAFLGRTSDALGLIGQIDAKVKAATALGAIAPLLPSSHVSAALDEAWRLRSRLARWTAVSRLVTALPEASQADATRRALDLAADVAATAPAWVAMRLDELGPSLQAPAAQSAVAVIEAMSESQDRDAELATVVHMLPIVPEEAREEIEARALAVARERPRVRQQAASLIAVAAALTPARRDEVMLEALSAAARLEDVTDRQGLVDSLVGRVDAVDRARLLAPALAIGSPVGSIWEPLRERLDELIGGLDREERSDVLRPVLASLAEAGRKMLEPPELLLPRAPGEASPGREPPSLYAWLTSWGPRGEGGEEGESLREPDSIRLPALPPPLPEERVVNTGFAPAASPTEPLDPNSALERGARYAFWFEIGPPLHESIEREPIPLPRGVPAEAVLTVAVFGFAGELEPEPGNDVGDIRVAADGTSVVVRQPSELPIGRTELARRRLVFPVRSPHKIGLARLRCCVYYQQILLQSRVVEVEVADEERTGRQRMRSVVDYAIVHDFRPERLVVHEPYRLSALLNANGDGTHSLRVLADDGAERRKLDLEIDGQSLSDQIAQAREGLRRAAWGSREQWTTERAYKYLDAVDDEQFQADLISLAICGYRLYHLLARARAATSGQTVYEAADELSSLLRDPGFIQFALKDSPRHLLPIALMYDYHLDTNAEQLRICPEFLQSLRNGRDLASAPCFLGACPQTQDSADNCAVCPSGFWGYRHRIGLPLTIANARDLPTRLYSQGQPRLRGGIYKPFRLAADHQKVLAERWNLDCRLADTRQATIKSLKDAQPQVVYFYCHGGVLNSIPFIRVGGKDELGIAPDNLFNERICWQEARPLVFINGCETTALDPERAIEFVSTFVIDAWASGVVGTEITVFEEMARPFAEDCLRSFLVDRLPIGEAVRQARLNLLAAKNPLGLAYVPFVLPTLQLEELRDEQAKSDAA